MKPPNGVEEGALWKLMVENHRRMVLEGDRDVIVLVTGYEGVGKTTLAIHYCLDYTLGAWDPGTCLAFEPRDVLDSLFQAKRGDIVLMDEGANGLFNRDAMTRENKALVTTAMVVRGRNVGWVICLPTRYNVDLYFRDHRVAVWMHVERRGLASVYLPVRNPFRSETWWKRIMRVEFGAVPDQVRDVYLPMKETHMQSKLMEAQDMLMPEPTRKRRR